MWRLIPKDVRDDLAREGVGAMDYHKYQVPLRDSLRSSLEYREMDLRRADRRKNLTYHPINGRIEPDNFGIRPEDMPGYKPPVVPKAKPAPAPPSPKKVEKKNPLKFIPLGGLVDRVAYSGLKSKNLLKLAMKNDEEPHDRQRLTLWRILNSRWHEITHAGHITNVNGVPTVGIFR